MFGFATAQRTHSNQLHSIDTPANSPVKFSILWKNNKFNKLDLSGSPEVSNFTIVGIVGGILSDFKFLFIMIFLRLRHSGIRLAYMAIETE
jgi:hypothetical protein